MELAPATPTTTAATATTNPRAFPKLAFLAPTSNRWTFQTPAKRINSGPDVARFLTSQAYRDIGLFVLQLNRALCPRKRETPLSAPPSEGSSSISAGRATATTTTTFTLASFRDDPPSVRRLQALLAHIAAIVDDAPPDPGPRRFGNVAFRTWHRLLEERVDSLLEEALAPEVLAFGTGVDGAAGNNETTRAPGGQGSNGNDGGGGGDGGSATAGSVNSRRVTARNELRAYFLGGFGSAQRLDYGTGHELSFFAFLGGLWKLGAFADGAHLKEGDIERSIVLGVIEPYLKVVRKLILTYTLEPAGSHGVWGLDDHSFLPYIFGSAQLTRPIAEDEPMPVEGSAPRAPKPADVVKPETVEVQRELNMYFSAVGFINDVKKGPFWEHSPILFDVSGIKDGWGKINKGMIKMFNAEVLSKFPVVQHFPFGSLFSWDLDPDAPPPATSVHMANQPAVGPGAAAAPTALGATAMPPPPMQPTSGVAMTGAPWAQATRMPGPTGLGGPSIPYSTRPPVPSVLGGRAPPPDPVERQGQSRPDVTATTTGRGEQGSTAGQIGLTKAPWARDS